ncbi:hypothetical protein IMZ48_07795 [Candidatus Bathyarchaeota archaeon]|nr:hypothetical protein [Candidatus Bathyarchaeota archaeon]
MPPGTDTTPHSDSSTLNSTSEAPISKALGPTLESKTRALSLLASRFTGSLAQKPSDKDQEEGGRGPLGLRLLHSSPDPLIDLVFVHGLRGGSVKTWRKGDDARFFWPQLWLPTEPGLRHVKIHSFGYDSDWTGAKTGILGVHDFGQSLL